VAHHNNNKSCSHAAGGHLHLYAKHHMHMHCSMLCGQSPCHAVLCQFKYTEAQPMQPVKTELICALPNNHVLQHDTQLTTVLAPIHTSHSCIQIHDASHSMNRSP
jgi:hypothetical protein